MTLDPRSSAPPARHWLSGICAPAAWLVPLLVTLWQASPSPVWRDDLPIVRALGWVPVGTEGRVTTVLVQLASLIPLGGRWLRASWVGAVSVALASYLIFVLARRVLTRALDTPRLTPTLALAAALTASLAQSFQLEGNVAGGAPLATALVLGGVVLGFETLRRKDARLSFLLGAVTLLALSEAHAAGLMLGGALIVQGAAHSALPRARSLICFVLGFCALSLLSWLPLWIRLWAPHGGVDFGHGLEASSLLLIDSSGARSTALASWLSDVGVISFGLALAGLALGLARKSTRGSMAPLFAFVCADLAVPLSRLGALTPDACGSLRLLSTCSLAISAALAVQAAAVGLTRARIPFAEPASVLLVVFDFTLVFVGAEDSAFAADRRGEPGAQVWTDEALASVPAGGLLLLRSESLAFRLFAARLVRGERPDLVVVPMPLLERGNVRARLLAAEPALAPLIREVALSGKPSEYALSTLADARPLFLEFDPDFDHAQLEHLIPRAFFMHFAPEPLGRSDRVVGQLEGQTEFQELIDSTEHEGAQDIATRSVLSAEARGQALVAAALGDRKNLADALVIVRALDPADSLARELNAQMLAKPKGELSLARLLPTEDSAGR